MSSRQVRRPSPPCAMAFVASPPVPRKRWARLKKCTPRSSATPDPSPDASPDPTQATSSDWRAFRARLVREQHSPGSASAVSTTSFAHRLAVPEAGAVLLANPAFFTQSQGYFRRAVILLFAHDEAAGTAGLLLNRSPSAVTGPLPEPPAPFKSSQIRLGGDVGLGTVFACYPTPPSSDPHPTVLPGVSLLADVREVVRAVKNGEVKPERVRLYTRYCGWAPGQLDAELRREVWYLASVSSDYVLDVEATELYDRLMSELTPSPPDDV